MKKSSAELKREARERLTGNYKTFVLVTIINLFIPLLLLLPFSSHIGSEPTASQSLIYNLASIIVSLIEIILSCGVLQFYLNFSRGKEYVFSDVFSAFKMQPQKIVGTYLLFSLRALVILFPGILLSFLAAEVFPDSLALMGIAVITFIIGIIFTFKIVIQYNLIFYLYMDAPDEKISDIFKKSKQLMKGNNLRFLYLMLSFIGMELLGVLSFGIGLLWVVPYMTETITLFYLDVLEEATFEKPNVETDSETQYYY